MPYKGQEIMVTGPNGKYKSHWSHVQVDGRDVILGSEGDECILPEYTPIDFIEPALEEEKAPEKPGCMYQIWDREAGAMRECGAEAGERSLCPEHLEFVKDSTEGPFTKSKKAHPAGYDWNAKARAAYGIKGLTLAGMGKPSDAGKKPAPFDPSDIAAWNARRVASLYGTENVPAVRFSVLEVMAGLITTDAPCAELGPVPVVAEPEAGPTPAAEYTREEIEAACVRLMENKDTFRGTGIPGVLWNVGFRMVYQKREGTEKQIDYIRSLMVKAPDKYRAAHGGNIAGPVGEAGGHSPPGLKAPALPGPFDGRYQEDGNEDSDTF